MGRATRVDIDNGRFHVMNRGVNREAVFFSDADRVEFGRLLGVIWERFEVRTLAYCLMDNHYHLVLHCPAGGLLDSAQVLEIFGGNSLEFDQFVRDGLRRALVLPASEALRPILTMAVDQSFGPDTPGPNVVRTMIILLLDTVCERDRERLERLLDFPNPEAQDRAERRARQRRCEDPRLGSALGRAIGLFGGHAVPGTV